MSVTMQNLVAISTFPNGLSAHSARGILEDAGICTKVAGEDVVAVLNIGTAISPVKLLVREDDCLRAEQILRAAVESSDKAPNEDWKCPNCHEEVDAGFEVCWCCGSVHSGDGTIADKESAQPPCTDLDGARGCGSIHEDEKSPNSEQMVTRAWRASILGLIFLPGVLHIFSMILLLKASFADTELTRTGSRRFAVALVINIISAIALAVALLLERVSAVSLPQL